MFDLDLIFNVAVGVVAGVVLLAVLVVAVQLLFQGFLCGAYALERRRWRRKGL